MYSIMCMRRMEHSKSVKDREAMHGAWKTSNYYEHGDVNPGVENNRTFTFWSELHTAHVKNILCHFVSKYIILSVRLLYTAIQWTWIQVYEKNIESALTMTLYTKSTHLYLWLFLLHRLSTHSTYVGGELNRRCDRSILTSFSHLYIDFREKSDECMMYIVGLKHVLD